MTLSLDEVQLANFDTLLDATPEYSVLLIMELKKVGGLEKLG